MSAKPVSNLRKLKHIEKAAQRDWANRQQIRAAGLRALGFYSEPLLYPWLNPVKILYGMLLQVNSKRRAAIFRVARAALKQNALIKIQSLGNPHWLDIKKMDSAANFESEFKSGDLRKLKFSTPEQDRLDSDKEEIKNLIKSKMRENPKAGYELLCGISTWTGEILEALGYLEQEK